jgi:hypothetical protein
MHCFALRIGFVLSLVLPALAQTPQAPIDWRGGPLRAGLRPEENGALFAFGRAMSVGNFAGASGLLNEGLTTPNPYTPEDRVDAALRYDEDRAGNPSFEYTYAARGIRIGGLQVTRRMEPLPGTALLRCVWTIENKGTVPRRIVPWLGNDVRPGGTVDHRDALNLPAHDGLQTVQRNGWYVPGQAWIAATDPIERESLVAVFAPSQLQAFQARWDEQEAERGFQVAFQAATLEPGAAWKTTYVLGVAKGLTRVDAATEDLAVQADVESGAMVLHLAALRNLPAGTLEATLHAPSGTPVALPAQPVTFGLDEAVTLKYAALDSVTPGSWVTLRLRNAEGAAVPLGALAGSPDGAVLVALSTGSVTTPLPAPWCKKPASRTPRTLHRAPAWQGEAGAIWYEPALEKLFREDTVAWAGPADPTAYLVTARNEAESFQIALRPSTPWKQVRVTAEDLVHTGGAARISRDAIAIYNVDYMPVDIPSYLDGATGDYPDPLPVHTPFDAPAGVNSTLWVTVRVAAGLPPGVYRGALQVAPAGQPAITLPLEVYVYAVDLPVQPALRSDLGYWPVTPPAGVDPSTQWRRHLDLALSQRLTLRALPVAEASASALLAETDVWFEEVTTRRGQGLTTAQVSPAFADAPETLAKLDALAVSRGVAAEVFTTLDVEPAPEAFPALEERLAAWRKAAPHLAAIVPTGGFSPFLPASHPQWSVHLPVFQTTANKTLIEAVAAGKTVWAYLDAEVAPPFANLCLDRPAIEHRILGWQLWALGVKGFQYWCANYPGPPLEGPPVQGDGGLIYFAVDGALENSIRLETLRDAVEDYDLLALLVTRLDAAVKAGVTGEAVQVAHAALYPDTLMVSLTDFARDPAELLARRMDVLDALALLAAAKPAGGMP